MREMNVWTYLKHCCIWSELSAKYPISNPCFLSVRMWISDVIIVFNESPSLLSCYLLPTKSSDCIHFQAFLKLSGKFSLLFRHENVFYFSLESNTLTLLLLQQLSFVPFSTKSLWSLTLICSYCLHTSEKNFSLYCFIAVTRSNDFLSLFLSLCVLIDESRPVHWHSSRRLD